MDKGTGLLIPDIPVPHKADPRLKLLHELEPRYRVFFRNLTDTFAPPDPPLATTTRPGLFWHDVFIDSAMPWRSFMESILWHFVAVLVIWATSPSGVLQQKPLQQHHYSYRASSITYYPAARSAPPTERSQPRHAEQPPKPARQEALAVAREHRPSVENPAAPNVNLNGRTPTPNLASSAGPAPAVPLAATGRAHLNLPSDWTSVVAPPPDLGRAGGHRPGLPQATVVAPAPDAGAVSTQPRSLSAPGATVVAPPPTLQGWMHKIESLFGEGSSSANQVVPPPPSVQGADGAGGSRVSSLPGSGSQVIPPPPSPQGDGQNAGARMSAVPGVGGQVVPPPPNMQAAANGASGRFGSLSASGQVVPPPPSTQGAGNGSSGRISSRLGGSSLGGAPAVVPPPPSLQASANGSGSGRFGSLSGSQVVPPPPSVQGTGAGGRGGRLGSLSGSGTQVVPPPPSMQGTGSGGSGRMGSLAGTGSQVVPPPPSVAGSGNGGGSRFGSLSGSGTQVVPPPPSVQATGNGGGTRLGSLGGSGTQIVPPPPSVQAGGNRGGSRLGSLGGSGTQVVPPPPSIQGTGTGTGNGGRMGSLAGSGSQVVPPPPSIQGGGDNGGGTRMAALSGAPGGGDPAAPPAPAAGGGSVNTGPLQQMDDLPANPPPAAQIPNGPPPEDVPLRLISPVVPPKGSTFFSNYEVFLAERRISSGKFEPIKLVYQFLPYQRRLSEYGAEGAKVHTLRVIRDPRCDEPLMQMLWPDGDQDQSDPQASTNAAAFSSVDKKTMVPCFLTTAEDYLRALERGR